MTITTQQGEFAIALQYGKYGDGQPDPITAQGTATFSTNPADADTLTLNGTAYRFKTTPAAVGDILIGTTLADTLANVVSASLGTGNGGYFTGTSPIASIDVTAGVNTLFFDAYAAGTGGNSLTIAKVSTAITLSAATLAGGLHGGDVRAAWARILIAKMPLNTETLTVGSTVYTFSSTVNTGNNINITLAGQSTVSGLATTIGTRLASNSAVASIVVTGTVISFRTVTTGTAANSVPLSETVVDATAVIVYGPVGGYSATNFDRTALTWWRLRTREVDYGESQMQETIPLEVGGTLTPTGAYKSGVAIAGGAQIMPRLQDSIGVLLLAGLGKATTTNPSSGVGQHVFTFQTNEQNQPWLAARKMIPGRDSIYGQGVIGFDNKVNLLRTTVAATAPVEMMVQLMGRVPEYDNHPEVWSGQSFEDFTSIPLACKGSFSLPTVAGLPSPMPVTQVIVEMSNVTTTPREEMIVGSYFMDDVVTRTRALTLRFSYKWKDANLANYLFGNQLKATAWSPTPFITNTSGANYAVDLLVESPFSISGTTTPYSLRIRANQVFWQPLPIRLRAGDIVMLEIIGTVLYSASGYCEFVLTNGNTTGYAIPSEP